MPPRHILRKSLSYPTPLPSLHLRHHHSFYIQVPLTLPGELIHILDSRRRSLHFRISRMTSTPGPFFAWRLARATERYVSSFGCVRARFENKCHFPVTRTLGYLNSDHAFVPPARVLRAAPVSRVFRLGAPRPTAPAYTVRNARASNAPPHFTVLRVSQAKTRLFLTVPSLPETIIPALNADLGS